MREKPSPMWQKTLLAMAALMILEGCGAPQPATPTTTPAATALATGAPTNPATAPGDAEAGNWNGEANFVDAYGITEGEGEDPSNMGISFEEFYSITLTRVDLSGDVTFILNRDPQGRVWLETQAAQEGEAPIIRLNLSGHEKQEYRPGEVAFYPVGNEVIVVDTNQDEYTGFYPGDSSNDIYAWHIGNNGEPVFTGKMNHRGVWEYTEGPDITGAAEETVEVEVTRAEAFRERLRPFIRIPGSFVQVDLTCAWQELAEREGLDIPMSMGLNPEYPDGLERLNLAMGQLHNLWKDRGGKVVTIEGEVVEFGAEEFGQLSAENPFRVIIDTGGNSVNYVDLGEGLGTVELTYPDYHPIEPWYNSGIGMILDVERGQVYFVVKITEEKIKQNINPDNDAVFPVFVSDMVMKALSVCNTTADDFDDYHGGAKDKSATGATGTVGLSTPSVKAINREYNKEWTTWAFDSE